MNAPILPDLPPMPSKNWIKHEVKPVQSSKPLINLGAGRIILPCERPAHHNLIDEAIYSLPCINVDRNQADGIDRVVDLFTYPWPFEDNEFSGALACHLLEHVPHEIKAKTPALPEHLHEEPKRPNHKVYATTGTETARDREVEAYHKRFSKRVKELSQMQDGWFCFFSELYRVLENGAIVHILSPYAWSEGAIVDPSHTRMLTENTFRHSMQPDPNAPFAYETGGINFELISVVHNITPSWRHLIDDRAELQRALETRVNVAYEFSVKLKVVK